MKFFINKVAEYPSDDMTKGVDVPLLKEGQEGHGALWRALILVAGTSVKITWPSR